MELIQKVHDNGYVPMDCLSEGLLDFQKSFERSSDTLLKSCGIKIWTGNFQTGKRGETTCGVPVSPVLGHAFSVSGYQIRRRASLLM